MNKVLETIKDAITKPMDEMGIIICSIEYVTEGKYNFLKIELDNANGIDLDTVVKATEVINPIIDELDLIDESYILDISSRERGE